MKFKHILSPLLIVALVSSCQSDEDPNYEPNGYEKVSYYKITPLMCATALRLK